jgi:hypothetical protein
MLENRIEERKEEEKVISPRINEAVRKGNYLTDPPLVNYLTTYEPATF